jgi:hypothetical protein
MKEEKQQVYKKNKPNKCGNPECKNFNLTFTTPLWRKGPSGKKDWCNACGIK